MPGMWPLNNAWRINICCSGAWFCSITITQISYRRWGKIRWAKYSWFQCHQSFCGNIFILPWPYKYSLFSKIKERHLFSWKNFHSTPENSEKCESLAQRIFPCLRYIKGRENIIADAQGKMMGTFAAHLNFVVLFLFLWLIFNSLYLIYKHNRIMISVYSVATRTGCAVVFK